MSFIAKLFGFKKQKRRVPRISDFEVRAKAAAERKRRTLARGRASTILGASIAEEGKISKKTLLGS